MKIKKLTSKEIGEWIGKHVPDELTLITFPKMFKEFQNAIAKENMEPKKSVRSNFFKHSCKVAVGDLLGYTTSDWTPEEKLFQSMEELISDLTRDHVIIEA
jgi:hypothetical protein